MAENHTTRVREGPRGKAGEREAVSDGSKPHSGKARPHTSRDTRVRGDKGETAMPLLGAEAPTPNAPLEHAVQLL